MLAPVINLSFFLGNVQLQESSTSFATSFGQIFLNVCQKINRKHIGKQFRKVRKILSFQESSSVSIPLPVPIQQSQRFLFKDPGNNYKLSSFQHLWTLLNKITQILLSPATPPPPIKWRVVHAAGDYLIIEERQNVLLFSTF